MTDNLPAVRVETSHDLVNPTTDSWTVALAPVVELARSICGTDFVPDSLRDNVAGTTAAILYGRELGLPPMTALGSTHLIKGRVGVSAEILRALVLEQGHEIVVRESTGAQVVMAGRRKGTTDWTVVTWTLDDARRAKLGGDNWTKYPRQMLAARASAELCRLIFADVIHGMAATEELEGIDSPSLTGPAASTDGRAKVQRKTRTAKTDDGAAPAAQSADVDNHVPAAPSSSPMPPLPGEPGYDGADSAAGVASPDAPGLSGGTDASPEGISSSPAADPTDAGAAGPASTSGEGGATGASAAPAPPGQVEGEETPRPISRPQQRMLFARFGELGIEDDAERYGVMSVLLDTEVTSSNHLTSGQAKTVIDGLATCRTRDHVAALIDMIRRDRADSEQVGDA